jgi:hypothetical protein
MNLFDEIESTLVSEDLRKRFHSGVYLALFIAKRSRPDILLPIQYLSTKVLNPTESHVRKFIRVLMYLYRTKDLKMRLYVGKDKRIK